MVLRDNGALPQSFFDAHLRKKEPLSVIVSIIEDFTYSNLI